jgi:DNA-binding response OmpR family regulator
MIKVLLVEDTVQLAEEISDILRLEKFDVTLARNGQHALELLPASQPDIIVTDLLMPVMDGFQLVEQVRSTAALNAIPIIILSAKSSPEDQAKGRSLGANMFVQKPCKAHELVSAINALLPSQGKP